MADNVHQFVGTFMIEQIIDLMLDGNSKWDIMGILDMTDLMVETGLLHWENMSDDQREKFKRDRAFFGG